MDQRLGRLVLGQVRAVGVERQRRGLQALVLGQEALRLLLDLAVDGLGVDIGGMGVAEAVLADPPDRPPAQGMGAQYVADGRGQGFAVADARVPPPGPGSCAL